MRRVTLTAGRTVSASRLTVDHETGGEHEVRGPLLLILRCLRPSSPGMQAMAAWYRQLGTALADGGAPFTGATRTVSSNGAQEGAIGPTPTGYSILEARSLAEATEIARGCPLLRSGRKAVLYETFNPM